MNTWILVTVCFLASSSFAFAQEAEQAVAEQPATEQAVTEQAATEQPAAEANALVEVGNKICPVSGEKAGEMGPAILHEHNGKIYNLCCEMCVKDFQSDPEKYSKIAEDEVAAAAAPSVTE